MATFTDPYSMNDGLPRRSQETAWRRSALPPAGTSTVANTPPALTPQQEQQVRGVVENPMAALRDASMALTGRETPAARQARIAREYTHTPSVTDMGPSAGAPGVVPSPVAPGVFRSRQKIGGVEQNVYSDSAFDPLHYGATNANERRALERRSPQARGDFVRYDMDRARAAQNIQTRQNAAQADAAMWRAAELSDGKNIAPWNAGAELAESTAKAAANQSLATRRDVESASMDAEAQRASSDAAVAEARRFTQAQAKNIADRFAADPNLARQRWGDVAPQQAAQFELLQAMVSAGINPDDTPEGTMALNEFATYLQTINNASGTGPGYAEGAFDPSAFATGELPLSSYPEQVFGAFDGGYELLGPVDPTTGDRRRTGVRPTGEGFERDNLQSVLARLQAYRDQ